MMRRKNNMRNNNTMRSNNNNKRFNPNSGGRRPNGNRRFNNGANSFEGKTKQQAMQGREKYQNMAQDARVSNDRVLQEYYLQHVEHFNRIINHFEAQEQAEQARKDAQQESHDSGQDSGQDEQGDASDNRQDDTRRTHGNSHQNSDAQRDDDVPRQRQTRTPRRQHVSEPAAAASASVKAEPAKVDSDRTNGASAPSVAASPAAPATPDGAAALTASHSPLIASEADAADAPKKRRGRPPKAATQPVA